MATTTNFGWETPDDTDLVKDGAAAMRTLGNSIDTSFVDLKGGTTNQVLAKNSNTDLDFKWVADATGIPATIIDAKGDLIVGTAADTAARLAVGGTNGHVLTVDSTESAGMKWAAVSGGGMTLLSTTTLTSTTTTISITSTGYNYLYIYLGEYYNAGDTLKIRFNSDTGNNYSSSYMSYEGNGSATGSTAPSYFFGRGQDSYRTYVNASSPYTMNAVFLIHDPTSSENDKLVQYWAGGTQTATPFLGWNWGQGFYQGSGAITGITLFNNNTHSGTVKIYGVK